jgi:hypothetical protein
MPPPTPRVFTVLLLLTLPAGAAGERFIRGMALGSYSDIRKAKLELKLSELKALEASHVSLVVSWSTPDVRSTTIAPRSRFTTPDPVLERMIRRAHAHGLKVFLFPILDVRKRKPLEWRGTLKPKDWNAWWRSYHRFILHYARVAARNRVAMFCVGSELVTTEKMRDRWEAVIAKIRKTYRGQLVYSANWDHYNPVVFWDLVDVVGLTAYYQLTRDKKASEETMVRAWRSVRKKLVSWATKARKRFLFTEVGYPSMDGCAVHPWDYTLSAPVDLEEQRRAFSAFIKAWDGTPQLAGVIFWDWYGEGGPRDTRYTPRGKPAEKVIRSWFRRLGRN